MSTSPDNSKKANDGGPTIPDSSPFSGGPVGGMMTPSALSGSAAAVSEKSEKPAYVSAGTSQQSVQGVSSSSVMSQVEHMKTPAPLILKLPMLRMRVASSMPGPILSEPPAGREKSTMQINIETLTGRSIPLTCESNELVSKVKEIIWDKDKTVSRQDMTAISHGFVLLQTRRLTFLQ